MSVNGMFMLYRGSCVEDRRSTYLARMSASRLHGVAGRPRTEGGHRKSVRDDGDGEPVGADVGDREAHAVDGDRALVHHVAQHVGRRGDLDAHRAVGLRRARRGPRPTAVDVALHQVPTEPVGQAHRALEVHRVARGERRRATCAAASR